MGHPPTGASNNDLFTAAAGSTEVVVVLAAPAEATLDSVVVGLAPGLAATVVVVDEPVPPMLVVEDAPAATDVEVPAIDDAAAATLVDEPVAPAVVDEPLLATLVGTDDGFHLGRVSAPGG